MIVWIYKGSCSEHNNNSNNNNNNLINSGPGGLYGHCVFKEIRSKKVNIVRGFNP